MRKTTRKTHAPKNNMQSTPSRTVVGCLRTAMLSLFSIGFSVSGAMAIGVRAGFWMGLFSFFGLTIITLGVTMSLSENVSRLTIWDCLSPLVLGSVSAVCFTPFALLLNGSFFSFVTCVGASLFLTIMMFLYRAGKINGIWLLYPFIVFLYEILPFEFPTELDNYIAFGGNVFNTFAAQLFRPKQLPSSDKPQLY